MNRVGFNRKGGRIKTDAPKISIDRAFEAHIQVPGAAAVVANPAGIHAAVVDNAAQQVITTGITQPAYPRNITATAGGTAADVKAIQVTIEGTNFADEVITETLPAFTVNAVGIVQGNKAFKTVTKITIPAHDGVGATTAIGFGEKMGIPFLLAHNTVRLAFLNNVKEGTDPVVTVSPTALEDNTFDTSNALNGTIVDVYLVV